MVENKQSNIYTAIHKEVWINVLWKTLEENNIYVLFTAIIS